MSDFLTPLQVEFIDGCFWRLIVTLEYYLGAANGLDVVKVPSGFVTDFASIPRGLWNLFPPIGRYGKAAVLHDYLYQKRIVTDSRYLDGAWFVTRAEADHIFLEAMQVLGVGFFTRYVIYAGVRVGGWLTWNKYRRAE